PLGFAVDRSILAQLRRRLPVPARPPPPPAAATNPPPTPGLSSLRGFGVALAWDKFASAPQIAELDALALKRKGAVSTKDCKEVWCCPGCKDLFPPRRNLLVDLPEYECRKCHYKNPTSHDWKIPDTVLNGVPLEFMVYDQGHCMMYSSITAMDGARRVQGALCGISKCAAFDVSSALETYKKMTGFECGSEPTESTYGGDTAPIVLTFLKNHGVPYSRGEFDPPGSVGCLKLKDYFMVDKSDINLMKRLIGSGYPLLAGINIGAMFRLVNNRQVYNTPTFEGAIDGHALALIGFGIERNRKGDLETYFIVRDTSGCHVHSDYQKQGLGGDMCIWASDVYNVWGFRLEDLKV
ncbi:unnamed protein product, partial [Urochloa humidicola]